MKKSLAHNSLLIASLFHLLTKPTYAQTSPSTIWSNVGKDLAPNFRNPATFIGELLGGNGQQPGIIAIAIVLGGMAMFIMLLFGGFTMLTNPTNPQGQEAGKQRITWAVVGFFVLFATFWIIQILEIIFGIKIT